MESDGHIYQTRARGNFRKKGQTPYVGDQVEFSAEENSEGYISVSYTHLDVYKRQLLLSRIEINKKGEIVLHFP